MKKDLMILAVVTVLIIATIFIGGNETIRGAATFQIPEPSFGLDMEGHPSKSSEGILYGRGVYETSKYKGKIGRAWQFDGKSDYVITSSTHLKDSDEFTIMFWVQPSSLSKRSHMVWQGDLDEKNRGENAGNGWGKEQEFHISTGDELGLNKYDKNKLTLYFGDEINNLKITTPLKFVDWQHVAVVVKNYQGGVAEIYLDGSLIGKEKLDFKIDQEKWKDATLYLGKAGRQGPPGDSDRYFEGMLDELAIYDYAVSADNIYRTCRRQNDGDICGT